MFLLDLVVDAPAGPIVPRAGRASVSYSTSVGPRYHTVLLPDRIAVPAREVH